MNNLEYTNQLTETGLSLEQAVIYELLIALGERTASSIAKHIPPTYKISRPLVYKVLEELISLNLAEKKQAEGKIATFIPKHPTEINSLIDAKKAHIEKIRNEFIAVSGKLSSLFNLAYGKPGVQFYEGKDGIWEVLNDSLTAQSEILTYADLEAINKYIPDLNAEYSALREEKKIMKRGLVIDSPAAREFLNSYSGNVTTTKLILKSGEADAFKTIMQIYDEKVSYITLTDSYLVGIIITDKHIAQTHRYLFESMWQLSTGEILKK